MNKLKSFIIVIGIVLLASCVKASERASGNYTGNYTINGQDTSGTTIITAEDNYKVTMDMDCSGLSVNSIANSVKVTLCGGNVTFNYNSTTSILGEVISINGVLTGSSNSLNYTFIISLGGNATIAGIFSGTM